VKAFIATIVVPNEWSKQALLEAVNSGIQNHIRAHYMQDSKKSPLNWSVSVKDELDLKRQDI
jgi:hypothetical protein